jgi:hypothetical protein
MSHCAPEHLAADEPQHTLRTIRFIILSLSYGITEFADRLLINITDACPGRLRFALLIQSKGMKRFADFIYFLSDFVRFLPVLCQLLPTPIPEFLVV